MKKFKKRKSLEKKRKVLKNKKLKKEEEKCRINSC